MWYDLINPSLSKKQIHLVPLESLILHMISLGLTDIANFPFLEKPDTKAIEESIEKLKFCGALKLNEDYLVLTPLGQALGRLPVDLAVGKMLIMSTVFNNVNSVLALAALLSVQDPLTQQAYRNSDMQVQRHYIATYNRVALYCTTVEDSAI